MRIICNKKVMAPMKSTHHGEVFRFREDYYMKIANTNSGVAKDWAVSLLDGFIYDESFFDSDVYEVDTELHVVGGI